MTRYNPRRIRRQLRHVPSRDGLFHFKTLSWTQRKDAPRYSITIDPARSSYHCTCPAFQRWGRGKPCKHVVRALRRACSLAEQRQVAPAPVAAAPVALACGHCGGTGKGQQGDPFAWCPKCCGQGRPRVPGFYADKPQHVPATREQRLAALEQWDRTRARRPIDAAFVIDTL